MLYSRVQIRRSYSSVIRMIWCGDNFDYSFSIAEGNLGGIIIIWDKGSFDIGGHTCAKHFVVVEGKWVVEGLDATVVNVYAPNGSSDQKQVWEEISELKGSFLSPWIIGVTLTQ